MGQPETIYIPLLDEGVAVWRPAAAERLAGDTYRIAQQDYDRDTETWAFEPGAVVRVRTEERDGAPVRIAVEEVRQSASG